MEKNLFKPYLIVVSLMILTSLALAFKVDVRLEDEAGVVMKLPDTLDGGWVGNRLRFCHNKSCCETSCRAVFSDYRQTAPSKTVSCSLTISNL